MAPSSGYVVPSSQFGLRRAYSIEDEVNTSLLDDSPHHFMAPHENNAIIPPMPESFEAMITVPPPFVGRESSDIILPPPPIMQEQDRIEGPPSRNVPQLQNILPSPPRGGVAIDYQIAKSMRPSPSMQLLGERQPLRPNSLDAAADRSTLSWVNTLLGWIWPKANKAIMQWVHEDFTPRLQEALPSPFKGLHFSTFSLGRNTPDFGPVEVIQHSDSHVQLDLDINYISDVDILIDAGTGGITFGINQLKFAGRLCIVLRPLVNKWPLIGAMKWFFCDTPKVALRFSGLAAVAHYPGLDAKVQSAVDEWIRSRAVLPNSRVWNFTRNEDIVDPMEAASHEPLGIVRARVLRAWNLAGVNWSALAVDRFMSDPYCIVKVGDISHRSSTVTNTTNPSWPSQESSGFFVVHHKDQSLEIDVVGDDSGRILARNFVSFLGRTSIPMSSIMASWPQQSENTPGSRVSLGSSMTSTVRCKRVPLDTTNVTKDMLHVNDPIHHGARSEIEVEVEWFRFGDRQTLPAGMQMPMAVLYVELHKGNGFPQEGIGGKNGLRWRSCLRTEGQNDEDTILSRRGQPCDIEQIEFPDVPIHPRLHSVIDKLSEKKFPIQDIAQIVGTDNPEIIDHYLRVKAAYVQKHQDMAREQRSRDHRISLQWYQTLTHFVRRLEPASLTLELLDGEDNLIGYVGPLSLRQLFNNSPTMAPRTMHSLYLPRPGSGGLASWFTPTRKSSVAVERFATVELQLSVRLRYLEPAPVMPKRAPQSPQRSKAHSL
jgi:hypothetical protein